MSFIISQIIGLIVTLLVAISFQCKKIKTALALQGIGNGLVALNYILLGGFSGCGSALVACIQTAFLYFFKIKEKKTPAWFTTLILMIQIALSLFVYKVPIDLLATLAAVASTLALAQENLLNFRILALICGALWIGYDVYINAYTLILNHSISVISPIVGIIRNDLNKNTDK